MDFTKWLLSKKYLFPWILIDSGTGLSFSWPGFNSPGRPNSFLEKDKHLLTNSSKTAHRIISWLPFHREAVAHFHHILLTCICFTSKKAQHNSKSFSTTYNVLFTRWKSKNFSDIYSKTLCLLPMLHCYCVPKSWLPLRIFVACAKSSNFFAQNCGWFLNIFAWHEHFHICSSFLPARKVSNTFSPLQNAGQSFPFILLHLSICQISEGERYRDLMERFKIKS